MKTDNCLDVLCDNLIVDLKFQGNELYFEMLTPIFGLLKKRLIVSNKNIQMDVSELDFQHLRGSKIKSIRRVDFGNDNIIDGASSMYAAMYFIVTDFDEVFRLTIRSRLPISNDVNFLQVVNVKHPFFNFEVDIWNVFLGLIIGLCILGILTGCGDLTFREIWNLLS